MSLDADVTIQDRPSLWRLFLTFLKIGCISWGGYMALISVVRSEISDRRALLEDQEIMDGVALALLLPGPVAVNVVAYVGNRLLGALGAMVCVIAVVLPSFAFMLGLAVLYLSFGEQVSAGKALLALQPAIAALVLNAAWKMRKTALSRPLDWALAVGAASALLISGGVLAVVATIVVAGVCGMATQSAAANPPVLLSLPQPKPGWGTTVSVAVLVLCVVVFLAPLPAGSLLVQLFSVFSGMSLMLFGGGYIFIPMLQEVVVEGMKWLTQVEFAASIAMGQVTPGPILISATFIGFKTAGGLGALVATVAIFAPPAILMVVIANQLDRLRHFHHFTAAQSGIRAAVIGMIAAAAVTILRSIELDGSESQLVVIPVIFGAALLAMLRFKVTEVWVLVAAALVGVIFL
ncbi:MAG: chromate efflux transporter [Thalassovita sp.]